MRTTMNLDPALVDEVKELTGEKNRGKAVNRALEDYVRRRKIEKLISLRGKIDLRDNSREWDQAELLKMKERDDYRRQ